MDNKHPKIIGLLGGMSWPSTITYYREINRAMQSRFGGSHSARLLIWSDDYRRVESMQLAGDWEGAAEWIVASAQRLEAGGAEILGIACNTMHRLANILRSHVHLPLIDMVEATAAAVAARGCSAAGILATKLTLESGLYAQHLSRRGVQPLIPDAGDADLINRIIYEELCLGIVTAESRAAVGEIAVRLVARGADAIVLACTELGLIIDPGYVEQTHVIDATQVHINALVEASDDG
jgi:aspartate racemase